MLARETKLSEPFFLKIICAIAQQILLSAGIFRRMRNNMKNIISTLTLVVVALGIFFGGCSQYDQQKEVQRYQEVFRNSLRYGDGNAAATALYHLIEMDLPDSLSYKDTLAALYFDAQMWANALLVAEEMLQDEANAQDTSLLIIAGTSSEKVGRFNEALGYYQRSYVATKKLNYLYLQATLHYRMAAQGDTTALATGGAIINRILGEEGTDTEIVKILFEGNSQFVPVAAATWNLKGILLIQQSKFAEAREAFNKSLGYAPDFILPQNNLKVIEGK